MSMLRQAETRVVLCADDDDDAQVLLKLAFAKASATSMLVQVNDGSETIRYLAGEGKFADRTRFPLPDLLLLDLNMPTSGFQVLEHLRQHPEFRVCQVAVFSSSTHPGDVTRARELGCDVYVTKPCGFEKLIEVVREIDRGLPAERKAEPAAGAGTKPANPAEASAAKATPALQARAKASGANPNPAKDSPERQTSAPPRADPVQRPTEQSQSPEVFRLLVEQVKDYAIFMLDPGGIVRTWNEGARRIKGYEAQEIIGQHFSVFYTPGDIESEKPGFDLRMAQEMGRYEEEGWRLRKDKSRFWANVTITPLRDAKGEMRGYAKVTRDLTQSKLQEESFQRLLESEERFRVLVEQVKDYAIFMLDPRGNVISWNQGAKRIKGYSADEIVGKHFSIFYTEEELARDHPAKELAIAIREGRYEEEGWRKRKDGGVFWANVVITALWDKRGNLTGFAKVTRDLTQRKADEDALRQKNEALEAFAHTLSHDLRAPVRSIASFAEILSSEGRNLPEADKERYLNKIRKSAAAMNVMITEILNLSQVSTAPAPQHELALDEVMAEALRLLEMEIQRTGAEVRIAEPLPTVIGNRTLLIQIFFNLLSNALKFTRAGERPRVEVWATRHNGHGEIHVRDEGIGVPEEMRERIFTAFDRGNAPGGTAGMGVGLAIVRKAAERMGGDVVAQPRAGRGTDFVVTLHCGAVETATLQFNAECGTLNAKQVECGGRNAVGGIGADEMREEEGGERKARERTEGMRVPGGT